MQANRISSGGSDSVRSLLRSIQDGTAGAVTRLLISLACGLFLAAAASVSAYALACAFPATWARVYSYGLGQKDVYVADRTIALTSACAGFAYLGVLFWIWSRHRHNRGLWLGAFMTVGFWVTTIVLCVAVDELGFHEEEFLIFGIVCAAGGCTLVGWLLLYRRYSIGRTLYTQEGVLDLRCPACRYSMVGLKESRCPECGHEYTLDQLLSQQDFDALRRSPVYREGTPPERLSASDRP